MYGQTAEIKTDNSISSNVSVPSVHSMEICSIVFGLFGDRQTIVQLPLFLNQNCAEMTIINISVIKFFPY